MLLMQAQSESCVKVRVVQWGQRTSAAPTASCEPNGRQVSKHDKPAGATILVKLPSIFGSIPENTKQIDPRRGAPKLRQLCSLICLAPSMQEAFQFNFFQPSVNQADASARQQPVASDSLAAAEVSREAIQVLLRWLCLSVTPHPALLMFLSVVQQLTVSVSSRPAKINPKCSWTTVYRC